MKTKYIKMKQKDFLKDPMWTDKKETIAEFRDNIKVETIDRYLASTDGKGGLILGKDEKGGIWFRLEKPKGAKRGRKSAAAKTMENETDSESAYAVKKLTKDEFVKVFHRDSALKKKIIKEMIDNKLIDSVLVDEERLYPYKGMSTTLIMIKKNKKKVAEEVKLNLVEEQEIEDEKIDPNEPQIGLPVPAITWTNFCKKITYAQLKEAGKKGFFNDIDPDLFYAKNVGTGQARWEFEWPGIALANKIGNLIDQGASDSKRMGKAIVKLLLDNDYKGMGKKEPQTDTSSEGDWVPREEYDNFKAAVKKKVNELVSNFENKINEVEILARKTHAIAKENQTNVGHLSVGFRNTATPEPDLKEASMKSSTDSDWI